MNKKGQLDMVITSIVVFFIIFFIMAIFVFITIAISTIKGDQSFNSVEARFDDFLMQKVTVPFGEENELMEMFVIEAIVNLWKDELDSDEFGNAMLSIVDEDHPCLQYGDFGGSERDAIIGLFWGIVKSRFGEKELGVNFMDHAYVYESQGDGSIKDLDDIKDLGDKFLRFTNLPDTFTFELSETGDLVRVFYYYGKCTEIE